MDDPKHDPSEVPFWMRAAITQPQLMNLKAELQRLYKELEEYRFLVEELRAALAKTRSENNGKGE